MPAVEGNQAPPVEIPQPDMAIIAEMQVGIVNRFLEIQKAKAEGKPVVLSSVLIPREILQSMDVAVMYGNVLGAYASVFGLSPKYCQLAEEMGVPRDACTVNRLTIGLACADERDPFFNTAFVTPDLMLGGNFPCMAESKSLLPIAKKYNCPYYVVDTPMNSWGTHIPDHAIAYVAKQFEGLIKFLEGFGHTFDIDRLREEVAFSKKINELFLEIDRFKMSIPSPMKAYDSIIASTAPLVLSKEMMKIETFERLRDELKERVERGHGVIENEKLRLLWLGIPPLSDFKLLSCAESQGAVFAKNLVEFLTGFNHEPDLMDPDKPLETIARAHLSNPVNPASKAWLDYFVGVTRDYKIDGVVSVVQRSCGMIPCLQRITKETIYRETGVPTLVFDLDCIDSREYDPAATKASINSFVETLLRKKGAAVGNN